MPHYESQPTVDTTMGTGDWRDQLFEDGYVILKGIISPEKAQSYRERMFEWVEGFPYGFKADDPSTWEEEHLPGHIRGGMYYGYHIQHEKVLWDARTEPAMIEAFSKLWGTDELLVSFDGMNLTLPTAALKPSDPWPHVDSHPDRKGMQCVQGILNLAPNGPDDGGLVVMKGSSRLNEMFYKMHPEVKNRPKRGPPDSFQFLSEEVKWFEDRGCELVKVCAEPGDLVMWDSRTIHYNKVPTAQNLRAAMYICYTPAKFATKEDLEKKAELFRKRSGTTHWPHANIFQAPDIRLRLGEQDTFVRDRPMIEPEETPLVLKLAGVLSY